MKLTDKELEIMVVLWGSGHPLTASEIIEASENRSWKENSIYIIMNTLIKKGAIVLAHHKPTNTNSARAYKPTVTSEEYTVSNIRGMMKTGVNIDMYTLVKRLMNAEED